MKGWIRAVVTWFGAGRSPWAPGTVGTLCGIPLVVLFGFFGPYAYMVLTLLFTLFSIVVIQVYEGSCEVHDSSEIVLDEVVGMLITMTWIPLHPLWVGLGFLSFRFFDVLKPFPIRWVDRKVKGGLGVVADDVLAGIFSNVILQILFNMRIFEFI